MDCANLKLCCDNIVTHMTMTHCRIRLIFSYQKNQNKIKPKYCKGECLEDGKTTWKKDIKFVSLDKTQNNEWRELR